MNLECSSKGDKRFSALYAKVMVNNKLDSIENHYQLAKVFKCKKTGNFSQYTDFKSVKQAQRSRELELVGFKLNNKLFKPNDLTNFYKSLWCKYFYSNRNLLDVINKYSTFTDMFKAKNTVNSQSDVIAEIKNNGLIAVNNSLKDFYNRVK